MVLYICSENMFIIILIIVLSLSVDVIIVLSLSVEWGRMEVVNKVWSHVMSHVLVYNIYMMYYNRFSNFACSSFIHVLRKTLFVHF